MNSPRSWTMLGLVIAAAVSRLVPHAPNVAPMAALALFSGAYFASRRMATVVAMGALFLSDLLLHVTFQAGWQPLKGFYPGQWAIYACTLASVGFGTLIRRRRGVATTAAATLAGSVLFFLVTNLVYVYGADSIYPRTLSGVLLSYEEALPYFRYTLLGDAFYVTALFGAFALAEARFPALRREKPAPVAA